MTTTTTAAPAAVTTAEQLHGQSFQLHLPSLQAAALFASTDKAKPELAVVQLLPAQDGGTVYWATNGHVACRIWHHVSACPDHGRGSQGWVIDAAGIPGKRLTVKEVHQTLGVADVTCLAGQWVAKVTTDRRHILPVQPVLKTDDRGRLQTSNGAKEVWAPGIAAVWPTELTEGFKGTFNAAYLALLQKAGETLIKAEVRDCPFRKNTQLVGTGETLLTPATGKAVHGPVQWDLRLSNDKGQAASFLVMPVQIRR